MAFSWILGKRREASEETADTGIQNVYRDDQGDADRTIDLADVRLAVDDGLLVATGPLGDPLTPSYLKEACARQPETKLIFSDGSYIDQSRAIAVLEAQQESPLADTPTDAWIETMLRIGDGFEQVAEEDLAKEDQHSKTVLTDRLTLDLPWGETITLCDAHPGTTRSGSAAQLLTDGGPISIKYFLDHTEKEDTSKGGDRLSAPTLAYRDGELFLFAGKQIEARLAMASDIWNIGAKVDLLLGNGRPTSIADLVGLMNDAPSRDFVRPETGRPTTVRDVSYPLLDGDQTALDLSNATIVMVSGLPEAWRLSQGMLNEDGNWMLDPSDLAAASVTLSGANKLSADIEVQVISVVGHTGALKKQTVMVSMPPDTSCTNSLPASGSEEQISSAIQIAFGPAELELADKADALLLRGIPSVASLSSGTYDAALQGWILTPRQLDQLTVRGLQQQEEGIDVVLTAIYFDETRSSRTEIIAERNVAV